MAKQRANNEMSVYYDPSGKGSWKAAVTVPGSGGRRKVRRGKTRAEAFEKGMELLGQIRSSTLSLQAPPGYSSAGPPAGYLIGTPAGRP